MTKFELDPTFTRYVLGERDGYVALAFGREPWTETRFRWQQERDQIETSIDQELAAGPVDVYLCPAVRTTDERRKTNALPPMVLWADLDKPDRIDVDLLRALNPMEVESGTPGHLHIYVPLTREVTLAQHEALNKALRDHFDGDHKWSNEALLRMPGTLNCKTLDPLPVTMRPWGGSPKTPEELADLLNVDLDTATVTITARPTVEAEPIDDGLPEGLRDKLNKRLGPNPDRSDEFHWMVGHCKRWGLTRGQTVTVMTKWRDTPKRYKDLDDVPVQVANSWAKLPGPLKTITVRDTTVDQMAAAVFERHESGHIPPANADKYFDPKTGLQVQTLADDIESLGPLALGKDNI